MQNEAAYVYKKQKKVFPDYLQIGSPHVQFNCDTVKLGFVIGNSTKYMISAARWAQIQIYKWEQSDE